jgi:hypothetical protein
MRADIHDAIASACSVEPTGRVRSDRGGRPLGEWLTLDRNRTASFARLRRRVLAFLRELPDDMTVAELRDELEE